LPIKKGLNQHKSSPKLFFNITNPIIIMSHFPLIYISSDDSYNEEISYYSDSEQESSGWGDYFPPGASSSTNMKPNKKISTPAPVASLEFYSNSSTSDDDDGSYTLSKELPQALTKALESAMVNMKWPAPEKPARLQKPPKQVLGLACLRKQSTFDKKRNSAQKAKHDYTGKDKKPME
jgi:hypothetical protein